MPENTWIYDTVWEEYREENNHTIDEMNEFIWQGNRTVIKDLESRANKMMRQMAVSYTHLTLPTNREV